MNSPVSLFIDSLKAAARFSEIDAALPAICDSFVETISETPESAFDFIRESRRRVLREVLPLTRAGELSPSFRTALRDSLSRAGIASERFDALLPPVERTRLRGPYDGFEYDGLSSPSITRH